MIKIINYCIEGSEKEPFTEWLDDLEVKAQSIVYTRLDRVALGNFGDCKSIKGSQNIFELRIDFGPGYRIYFGKDGARLVVLLIGGDKGSQSRDIAKAKRYWQSYKESSHE